MDWNDDGHSDLFAAGYAGIGYLFLSNPDGSLQDFEILKDKSGTLIRLETFYNFDTDDYETPGEEENADKANFMKAFDWDGDGDLDLLLSGQKGLKIRINEGTRSNPIFGTENIAALAAEKLATVSPIDWDGDGRWDIVGGSFDGSVYFYKNIGESDKPEFAEGQCLIEKAALIAGESGECSITQVDVADYNNDGKLDLIVGNNSTVHKEALVLSEEQLKEKEVLEKESELMSADLNAMYEKYQEKFDTKDKESRKKMSEAMRKDKAYQKLMIQYRELWEKQKKYNPEGDRHGYVWVALRK